jgi:hypothetical protein
MSELTPRNDFPYPSEREQPFYDAYKAGELAKDAAIFANSDNSNVVWQKGGIFSWDAATNTLFWTDTIYVNGHHSAFGGLIPEGSVVLQENEVIYFQLPRLVQNEDMELDLFRSTRIFKEGARLHDLRLFVTRRDDVLYFANGCTLRDGDTGVLFEAGLVKTSTVLPHEHQPAWRWIAPAAGINTLTPLPIITTPDLFRIDVWRNGQLLNEGATEDYTVDLTTGIITLLVPTVIVPGPDKFIVFRETRDATGVTFSSHQHAPTLLLKPTPGTSVLNALATAPFLLRIDVYRNGQLLSGVVLPGPATEDYTLDLTTGLVSLNVASALGDKFEIHRELAIP